MIENTKESGQIQLLKSKTKELVALIEQKIYLNSSHYAYSFIKWHSETLYILANIYGEISEKYTRFDKAGQLPAGRATQEQWQRLRKSVMLKTAAELEAIISSPQKQIDPKGNHPTLTTKKSNVTRADMSTSPNIDPKKIFVIHGRNILLRNSLFDFLRSIGLKPIEWSHAIAVTKKGTPSIGEILEAAFSHAQALIVLLSGDDEAKLINKFLQPNDEDYERNLTPQPRPNVLFEAGMAMGSYPNRTILVQIGQLRPWSDIAGKHITHLDNSPEKRNELVTKLNNAGCEIDNSGNDWLKSGDFENKGEKPYMGITGTGI